MLSTRAAPPVRRRETASERRDSRRQPRSPRPDAVSTWWERRWDSGSGRGSQRARHEALHVAIDADVTRPEWAREVQPVERGEPREGDVGLTRGEGSRAEVDHRPLVGLPLRLVDGHG